MELFEVENTITALEEFTNSKMQTYYSDEAFGDSIRVYVMSNNKRYCRDEDGAWMEVDW
jgi:hypothetical protein